MNFRKHMLLIVGGSIALVLLIATLFMLWKFYARYRTVNTGLISTTERLHGLSSGKHRYPCEENVALVQTNAAVLKAYFDDLFDTLKRGQVEPKKMEPAEFPLLLEKTIRKLLSQAAESGVTLPPRFAFGFDPYALGNLPNEEDVPRLARQLRTVEELCGLLYDAKVSDLGAIRRQVFEKLATPSSGASTEMFSHRRGMEAGPASDQAQPSAAEVVDPSGLFSKERYTLTFKARDAAVWDILNALARSRIFIVVTDIQFANENPVPKIVDPKAAAPVTLPAGTPPSGAGAMSGSGLTPLPEAKPKVLGQEERIVAGRELVKIVLDVDVYRFMTKEEAEQKTEQKTEAKK